MFRSLGLRSDFAVMRGLIEVEERRGYTIVRTPSEPDYWHGNIIIVTGDVTEPETVMGWFRAAFPDARHMVVKWDLPGPDNAHLAKQFASTPLKVAEFETLSTDRIDPALPPQGIVLRSLLDGDWARLADLQAEIADEEGYDPAVHRPFLEQRNFNRRTQIERGVGQWFGAFDGDLLVGTMGAFYGYGVGTIDAVETRASCRRQGICSALLSHAGEWLNINAENAPIVIIAEADEAPARLYRSRGFAHLETIIEVEKPSY